MHGVEIMELCTLYLSVLRKDPVYMKEHIQKVKNDINLIVETYSRNIQASYGLKRDLTQCIKSYLINAGMHDLFSFHFYTERIGWGAEKLKIDIKFMYEREEI